ncbi:hypothetical protein AAFF_G00367900 [Aldrovandia affinis]|uniref:Uncharacterized protein n=1 Tax=Aldrovandia affinis TaxID=143900 RepID=A0AAD7R520_9TELE|nr:hypothetical protein AAFF_G00367900 [Aldrovandia affinis]
MGAEWPGRTGPPLQQGRGEAVYSGLSSLLSEKMLNLLGREKPCFLFMELFLRNMPTRVQVALANTTITEPRPAGGGRYYPGVPPCPASYAPVLLGGAGLCSHCGFPGEFMPNTTDPWSAAVQRASLLDSARVFAPVPTTQHGVPTSQVPPGLRSAGYVFIRHARAHRGPLQPPARRPVWVLEHGPKHLVVDIGGRPEHVSVDRVKLAHLDVTQPVDLAIPPRRPPRASLHPR